jgi:hypothetical protein
MLSVSLVSTSDLHSVSFGTSRCISLVHRAWRPKLHKPAADYAGDHFRAKQFAQTTHLRERAPGDKQPGLVLLRF